MKNLDDRLLAERREYAWRQGTTLDGLVRDLLAKAVGRGAGGGVLGDGRGGRGDEPPFRGRATGREEPHER